ncbi:MAG: phosphoketolase family protein [Candidatus Campbellbacteria bacterium]|nr:phosphoketolase family protein [Candidatus Campbellbacteria bacterium]
MEESIRKYVRAADYLSAVQIYLQKNVLLENPLEHSDIKPRLLGHWGTCPGINFTYAHLNALIAKHDLDMLFVLGPGHGFPAIQSNLFLEGTLGKYHPEATIDKKGIQYISEKFSWPYGFPSHSNPEAPGVILEGGELGYSLSTAYGSILDNPDLITACVIGDGEAETGPLSAAWHINKLIDPANNGAVLPILHLNGYKISGPTMMGRMTDEELNSLFWGYGYEPYFVSSYEDYDVYERMQETLEKCLESIRYTQYLSREGSRNHPPRFPMIVLRTPKGWNSIDELGGKKIEDNHLSHQVIAKEAKSDPIHLEALESWLKSYRFEELFSNGKFDEDILSIVPPENKRMGGSLHAHGGSPVYKPLNLPDPHESAEDASIPGTIGSSSMRRAGDYLNKVFQHNSENRNFRLMSPDETYSNKLDKVFETTTRAFVWPLEQWDRDIAGDGRVMEMLSEHSLQGLAQGYILTGRHAVFASYEAFIQIVGSMADQYAKFLNVARDVPWRGDIGSLNYILTSSGWRQEHNGFSHQNPGFVDDMLQRQGCFVNVYFPPDGNSTLAVLHRCLASKQEINIIVAGKTLEPRWRTLDEANQDMEEGINIWDFASEEDPHVVFAAAGDYLTKESLAAIDILRKEMPEIRPRFVSVVSLSALGIGHSQCKVLRNDFDQYFTKDKPVIFNFHGYPQTIKQILFDYGYSSERFTIHGYEENGSTTTPFDMHVRNNTDRFTLAMEAVEHAREQGVISEEKAKEFISRYEETLEEHKDYIIKNGVDPDSIEEWRWTT